MKTPLTRRILQLAVLLLSPALTPAAEHCVVLQYHHVSEHTPRSTSLTPAEFDGHLEYMAAGNFSIQPLQHVVQQLKNGAQLPENCIAISFDDAYDSVYTEAFPRLRKRGWPFTLFVNTQGVDDGVSSYMTWGQMREMAEAGVHFGNHSHGHDHLIRRRDGENEQQWRERVRGDLLTASRRIAEELGQQPTLLAYPYGEYDLPLRELVRELGMSAFGQQSGPLWSGADRLALPRFPMAAGYAAMDGFRIKVSSLPLPLQSNPPLEPVLPPEQWRPVLALDLLPGKVDPASLNCYVSGQPKAAITPAPDNPHQRRVQATQPLGVGRSRYNCTAPAGNGRWYWISQTWIRRHADGRWYEE